MIRPFAEGDEVAIAGLVDADSDPLWVTQGHTLHGPLLDDGVRWRRTLVAEQDGHVVGAVSVARNRVHPGRLNLAVEVAVGRRRRGIATDLVHAARPVLPARLPLAAKVRSSDAAAVGLLRHFGGRTYQHCPAPHLDPHDDRVIAWCDQQSVPDGTSFVPLVESPVDPVDLWVEQYLWVHADWSPADRVALRDLALSLVAEADPHLTVVSLRGDDVTAVTWAFREADGIVTIVSETTHRDVADGVAQVAASLANCLRRLRAEGVQSAELDGHASDPHLAPVVATLPPVPTDPVDLVEILDGC